MPILSPLELAVVVAGLLVLAELLFAVSELPHPSSTNAESMHNDRNALVNMISSSFGVQKNIRLNLFEKGIVKRERSYTTPREIDRRRLSWTARVSLRVFPECGG